MRLEPEADHPSQTVGRFDRDVKEEDIFLDVWAATQIREAAMSGSRKHNATCYVLIAWQVC